MTEGEWRNHFTQIANDIDRAWAVFNAGEEIHRLARVDARVRLCLDADAVFWNMQIESLQTSLFVILGRLFDSTKGALSVPKFLDETSEHPGFFSKKALTNRKIAGGLN